MSEYVNDVVGLLEALDGDTYTIRITFPDGKAQRFKLGVLGHVEYSELVTSIPFPQAPRKFDKASKSVIDKTNDPDYRAKVELVAEQRRLLLLARSFEKGGHVLKGDLKASAAWLGARPANVVSALLQGFAEAHHGLKGTVEPLDSPFHGVGAQGDADTAELEPDDAG